MPAQAEYGEERIKNILNVGDYELLQLLQMSDGWRLYRKLLKDKRDLTLFSAMSVKEPFDLKEKVSIAAGLNLAINQLDILIKDYNTAKGVDGQSDKP
jgi:hypothetical protein